MKCASLTACVVLLVCTTSASLTRAALLPITSSVTFNLYGQDYAGSDAGVTRNPDTSGPMPIAVFPGITYSAAMFDPSPASLATASGNATYGSTGTNEILLGEGTLVQPVTAQTISTLKIDMTAAYLSIGATASHVSGLSYLTLINVYPALSPQDPSPFAMFDASLHYFINGIPLPDSGFLLHYESGPTGGPVLRNITGPDASVLVPQLNDGDILSIAGELTFTVNRGSFQSVVPEPGTAWTLLGGCTLLTRLGRSSNRRCSRAV
jgi:hypothetical protein